MLKKKIKSGIAVNSFLLNCTCLRHQLLMTVLVLGQDLDKDVFISYIYSHLQQIGKIKFVLNQLISALDTFLECS